MSLPVQLLPGQLESGLFEPQSARPRVTVGLNNDVNICSFGGYNGPCLIQDDAYKAARDTGADTIRYTLYWHKVEPRRGDRIWWQVDKEMERMHNAGFQVYLNPMWGPAWATGGFPVWEGFDGCNAPFRNPDGSIGVRFDRTKPGCAAPPPLDVGAYVDFTGAVTERYKDVVKFMGGMNEFNYNTFWPWGTWNGDEFTPDFKAAMDWVGRPFYETVKSIAPEISIIGPEMDDIGSLDRILGEEQGHYWDILSFHGYDWAAGYPEHALRRVDEFMNVIKRRDDTRPVWITETGKMGDVRVPGSMRSQAEGEVGFLKGIEARGDIDKVIFYRIQAGLNNTYGWIQRDDSTPENGWKQWPVLQRPVALAMREYLTGQPLPSGYPVGESVGRRRAVRRAPDFDRTDSLYDPASQRYVQWDGEKYVPR